MIKFLTIVTVLNLTGKDKDEAEFYNCPKVGTVIGFERRDPASSACNFVYDVKFTCQTVGSGTTITREFVICDKDLKVLK